MPGEKIRTLLTFNLVVTEVDPLDSRRELRQGPYDGNVSVSLFSGRNTDLHSPAILLLRAEKCVIPAGNSGSVPGNSHVSEGIFCLGERQDLHSPEILLPDKTSTLIPSGSGGMLPVTMGVQVSLICRRDMTTTHLKSGCAMRRNVSYPPEMEEVGLHTT